MTELAQEPPNKNAAAPVSVGEEGGGSSGSYSYDDPDRPRYGQDTVLERLHDYHRADGTYAYTVIVGRCPNGEKAVLRGRRVKGTDDWALARQEDELYRLPGLGTYRKGTGDEPDLLYRLHELEAAISVRPEELVFITEGEKDADTLCGLGFIATTNPNGALNWKPAFTPRFIDRDVCIMVDNDGKGRKRADLLVAELLSVVKTLKVIELPSLRDNEDVTDWLNAGNSKADLLRVIAETEPVTSVAEWAARSGAFDRNDEGNLVASIRNAELAIAGMGVTVRYDEFAGRNVVSGLPGFGPSLDDAALVHTRLAAETRWRLRYPKERWGDIITNHARRSAFHPVRDFLDGLHWDGEKRVDRWLTTYGGAEDSEYTRAVGAKCLIAAVRRVRQPGCKFDEALVLESAQGTGKSTALRILAVHDDWFTDDLPLGDSDAKSFIERVAGRWLAEVPELKGMRRSDIDHVKAMLSRQVDKARLAYARLPTEHPRQCVIIGTTNDSQYLRDMTGNRRFWPVKVRQFDLEALRRDRDQLWAEVATREAAGEDIRLPAALWLVAGEQQAAREIGDPFYDMLSERLEGIEKGKVRASDIWEIVGLGEEAKARRGQNENLRVSAAMQKLGWRRPKSKLRFDGRPQHAWVKGETEPGEEYREVSRKLLFPQYERPL